MTRNLKALGLVLAAAFALSAVSASAASAGMIHHVFYAHGEYLTAQQDPAAPNQVLGVFNEEEKEIAKVTCSEVMASAKISSPETAHESVQFGSIKYNNEEKTCTNSVIGKAKVKMNGCEYLFTGTTIETTPGKFHAEVHIICPEGKQIEIESLACTIKIPPQTPTHDGVVYKDENTETTEKAITVEGTVKGIHYTSSSGCQLAGIPAEGKNAQENANATVRAYKNEAHTELAGVWTESTETP